MRVVVEGCGDWAMRYLAALRDSDRSDVGAFFTYDSSFGLEQDVPLELQISYLQSTERNLEIIRKAGYAPLDVRDTKYRLMGTLSPAREKLPARVDAVFVVTPDRTHCDVAEYWLGRARYVFVEKPFDVSAVRVGKLCSSIAEYPYTQVRGVDHYIIRANEAALAKSYFLDRLQPNSSEELEFEFHMTEPVGNVANFRDRALSLQQGMIFDLGSHALALLLLFIDLSSMRLETVWSGVSADLAALMFAGAETFSIATISARTKPELGGKRVSGNIVIGKDIGSTSRKIFRVTSDSGSLLFDFGKGTVHFTPDGGTPEFVSFLAADNWATLFVSDFLEDSVPVSVAQFEPEGAVEIVRFLEEWRAQSQGVHRDRLPVHEPGAIPSQLAIDAFLRNGAEHARG